MLVLSRQPEEEIVIGESIVVKVVSIRGGKVKLGITAPKEVPIDRKEIRAAKSGEAQTGKVG